MNVRLHILSAGSRFASSSTGLAARALPSDFFDRRLFLLPSSTPSPSSPSSPSLFFFRRGLSARFFFFLGSSPSPAARLRLWTPICLTVSSSMACAGRSSMAMLLASNSPNCSSSWSSSIASERTESLSERPPSLMSSSSGISAWSSVTSMSWSGTPDGASWPNSSSISGRIGSPGSLPASGRGDREWSSLNSTSSMSMRWTGVYVGIC
jgi:hypothetical protein